MQKNEPDFCPLYATNTKCHDMKDLNCYLCACPNFRYRDEAGFSKIDGKKLLSFCSIDSKKSSRIESKETIHQDCSKCKVPHRKKYIRMVFKRDWKKIMKKVGRN